MYVLCISSSKYLSCTVFCVFTYISLHSDDYALFFTMCVCTCRGVVESSVAPPTVIMDTPGGGDNEDDEDEGTEEGEDKEYVVGDSAPLAPPTSEGPNGLPPVDSASDEPEGKTYF